MSPLWQHSDAHAFSRRRVSVLSSAWAVRPASLAASVRASVSRLCDPSLPGRSMCTAERTSRRASPVGVAPELIGGLVSRKVDAMRQSPNSNTRQKVFTRLRLAFGLPSCAFGSASARPLPVAGFGTRGRPNPSFKRTCLQHAA